MRRKWKTCALLVVLVQSLSWVWLFATLRTAACQASLSFAISQSLLKLMFIDLLMPSKHLILCRPLLPCLQSFQASGSFLKSQLFTWGGQNIGTSASASVLPMNIQGWFPLGLTGLISLQSKGIWRVFKGINSLVLNLLYGPTLATIHDYWKNHSFD